MRWRRKTSTDGNAYTFYSPGNGVGAMWSMRIPGRVVARVSRSHIVYGWRAFVLPPAHRDLRSRRKVEPHRSAAHEDDHKELGERGYSPFIQIYWTSRWIC